MIFFVLWKYLCNFAVGIMGNSGCKQQRSKSDASPMQVRCKSLPYIGAITDIPLLRI